MRLIRSHEYESGEFGQARVTRYTKAFARFTSTSSFLPGSDKQSIGRIRGRSIAGQVDWIERWARWIDRFLEIMVVSLTEYSAYRLCLGN